MSSLSSNAIISTEIQSQIDIIANRTKATNVVWEKKSIASFAPHPCVGCGTFLLFLSLWVIFLAGAIILLILGSKQNHYGYYIGGSILLGLIVTLVIYLLLPVLCQGLPCTLPKPPQPRYPFCSTTTSSSSTTSSTTTNTYTPLTSSSQFTQYDLSGKNVYIIHNPVSSTANTKKLLTELILPRLDEKNIKYTILPTRYAGHGYDYLKHLPFDNYAAIIILGGDGSLLDCVNGLLNRTDGQKLPFGLLPCGSGNSFSADALGTWNINNALDHIITGYIASSDVNHVQDLLSLQDEQELYKQQQQQQQSSLSNQKDNKSNQEHSKSRSKSTTSTNSNLRTLAEIDSTLPYLEQPPLNIYSINTCAYGLIGDLAVGAEKCRWIGPQRYQLCGLWGLCKKTSYPTTVIYQHDYNYSTLDYNHSKSLATRQSTSLTSTPTTTTTSTSTKPTTTTTTNTIDSQQQQQLQSDNNDNEIVIDSDSYITAFANHTKYFGNGHYIAPYSYINDNYCDVSIAKSARRGLLMSIFNQIPSGAHVMMHHKPLTQFKTKEMVFIGYKSQHGEKLCSPSQLYPQLKQYQDLLLQSSSQQLPTTTTATTTTSTNQSLIKEYALKIANQFESYLEQNFITIDGEIFSCYGLLYIKTIPNAFQLFINPTNTSLQNAAAQFQH